MVIIIKIVINNILGVNKKKFNVVFNEYLSFDTILTHLIYFYTISFRSCFFS